jgi:hypothetical protein
VLSSRQVEFYNAQGFLHVLEILTSQETAELADDLDWMVDQWANNTPG